MRWIYLPDMPAKNGFVLVWCERFYQKWQAAAYFDVNTNKFYALTFNGNGDLDSCALEPINNVIKWCGLCGIADRLNYEEIKEKKK